MFAVCIAGSSLLGCNVCGESSGQVWVQQWTARSSLFLADHRVDCGPIAAGTLFVEMARCALSEMNPTAGSGITLGNTQFIEMLPLVAAGLSGWLPEVRVEYMEEAGTLRISSRSAGGNGQWTTHAMFATAGHAGLFDDGLLDADGSAHSDCWVATGGEFYALTGNDYRGAFRSVAAVWLSSAVEKT